MGAIANPAFIDAVFLHQLMSSLGWAKYTEFMLLEAGKLCIEPLFMSTHVDWAWTSRLSPADRVRVLPSTVTVDVPS